MKEVFATYYTKEKGKLEFTEEEWRDFKTSSVTLHRECGPAIIYSSGDQSYYLNGKLHREDGPAIIWHNGYQSYYINGKRHREDGPAIIYSNGHQEYFLNYKIYSKEDYYKKLEEIDNLPLSLKLIHNEEWVRERAKR